jgi:hypothetical protein
VGDDVVGQRGVDEAGGIELLAGDGGADDGKDAGADDCADAKRGERPRAEGLLQPVFGFLRFPDQLIDRLAGKQLAGQGSDPRFESGGLSNLVNGGLCILRVPEWLAPGRNPFQSWEQRLNAWRRRVLPF